MAASRSSLSLTLASASGAPTLLAKDGVLAAPTSAGAAARWDVSLLPFLRTDGCRNFPIRQRPPSIFDGDAAVPPFTHPHLTLGWRVRPAPQLEKSVLVPHHPVLADPALPLQSEYPVQLRSPRRPPVVVL